MQDLRDMILNLVSPDDEKRNRSKFFFLSLFYDTISKSLPGNPYENFAENIASDKPSRILDICSGTGYTARTLAGLLPNSHIDALDISPEMLAVATERSEEERLANIHFHKESAAQLPFENETFDAVCVSLGLHELPTVIRTASLKESFRVLKPGGSMYAMDLDRPDSFGFLIDFYLLLGEPPYSKEVLSEGISQALQEAGFQVAQKQHWMGDFLQFVEARKP
ncbi:MAG: class I SAM-dependent methyltransferase [Spirochaetota bacterium]